MFEKPIRAIVVILLSLTVTELSWAKPRKAEAVGNSVMSTSTSNKAESSESGGASSVPTNLDREQTREQLRSLLERYPPELGVVLKLDPTLFDNPSYMTTYPAVASFVAEHPEVEHSPSFYLDRVALPHEHQDSPAVRIWDRMLEFMAIISVVLTITLVLAWLVRTLIEQRRWNRLSRVQSEVHGKLLDRFSSNEDLLAYIQTPAGKRFLEAAPFPVVADQRPMNAPFGRILWSIQIGLVLVALGLGLQFVGYRVAPEVWTPLFVLSVVALSVGVGFVLSAIASFVLSRRLGLLQPSAFNGAVDDARSINP